VQARVTAQLPAEKARPEATLRQAQVDLVKTVVDAVGVVHAMLLRIQALMLPIRTLTLAGH
jgi:hypothetical protein